MANSYISLYVHVVFSTKQREPFISDAIRDRLWAYMGGIARENGMKAIAVGGIENHVHILLSFSLVLVSMAFVTNVSYVVAFRQFSIPLGVILSVFLLKEPAYVPKFVAVTVMFIGLVLVGTG